LDAHRRAVVAISRSEAAVLQETRHVEVHSNRELGVHGEDIATTALIELLDRQRREAAFVSADGAFGLVPDGSSVSEVVELRPSELLRIESDESALGDAAFRHLIRSDLELALSELMRTCVHVLAKGGFLPKLKTHL